MDFSFKLALETTSLVKSEFESPKYNSLNTTDNPEMDTRPIGIPISGITPCLSMPDDFMALRFGSLHQRLWKRELLLSLILKEIPTARTHVTK